MDIVSLSALFASLLILAYTLRSYVRQEARYQTHRDEADLAIFWHTSRRQAARGAPDCCSRPRHEVSSPIDTVEMCIHSGHRRAC